MTRGHFAALALVVAAVAAASCRAERTSGRASPGASTSAAVSRASAAAPGPAVVSPAAVPRVALADAPGPAPSGSAVAREVRETAVLALLSDATFARRLPELDLEPGREFDASLRDRVAPRIVVPVPRVRFVAAKAEGALAKELVERVVRQNLGRYRACIADAPPTPKPLSGRLTLELSIEPDGHVTDVRSGASTVKDVLVVRCIVDATRRLTFPAAPARTRGIQILELEAPTAGPTPAE